MNITIEAIYKAGVLKPLQPLPGLKERASQVEVESAFDRLLQQPIEIDPAVAGDARRM